MGNCTKTEENSSCFGCFKAGDRPDYKKNSVNVSVRSSTSNSGSPGSDSMVAPSPISRKAIAPYGFMMKKMSDVESTDTVLVAYKKATAFSFSV